MSLLHTVNKSPFETNSLHSCVAHSRSGDAILLMEDAVYGAIAGTEAARLLAGVGDGVSDEEERVILRRGNDELSSIDFDRGSCSAQGRRDCILVPGDLDAGDIGLDQLIEGPGANDGTAVEHQHPVTGAFDVGQNV